VAKRKIKMFACLRFIVIIFVFLFTFNDYALAQPQKVKDLINEDVRYNGKKVLVEGEAIGHLMKRGDFAWININDNTESIGVWISSELTDEIKYLGRHAVAGDWLRISGVFNSNCSLHGGDTDIHADGVLVLKRGSPNQLTHEPKKVVNLLFLIGLMICLYIIKILKKKH